MENRTINLPDSLILTKVESILHWTDNLFSFRVIRPKTFRFRSGEFVMLGLPMAGKPLLRAYSMASPCWEDALDFYSIKIVDGPLTSRLQNIKPGDEVILGKKPTGTLVLDALKAGKRLFLFSTGTGIAPFASLIRDPETYEKYGQVVLTHTCRNVSELNYGKHLIKLLERDPLLGDTIPGRLTYFSTTTREQYSHMGRITDLLSGEDFFKWSNIKKLEPENDRAMICGSLAMIRDTSEILKKIGLTEGANSSPGEFVLEKAFAQ